MSGSNHAQFTSLYRPERDGDETQSIVQNKAEGSMGKAGIDRPKPLVLS